jgi:hypothetical protein
MIIFDIAYGWFSRSSGLNHPRMGYTDEALEMAMRSHWESRVRWGLPPEPPRTAGGVRCGLCDADCLIGEGEMGYCGLRKNIDGRLQSPVSAEKALLHGAAPQVPLHLLENSPLGRGYHAEYLENLQCIMDGKRYPGSFPHFLSSIPKM